MRATVFTLAALFCLTVLAQPAPKPVVVDVVPDGWRLRGLRWNQTTHEIFVDVTKQIRAGDPVQVKSLVIGNGRPLSIAREAAGAYVAPVRTPERFDFAE